MNRSHLINLMLLAGMAGTAQAQSFPAKPIRVIIPSAPASTTDQIFRVISPGITASLGQQLIADYRVGAGGTVGQALVAKSPADGYVVGLFAAGFMQSPAMTKNLPYDPTRDFTTLGMVADVPTTLVVHPSLPVKTVQNLIALARAHPGQLNSGNSGAGSNSHLAGLLFNQIAKINIVQVQYKSSALGVVDILGGHIQVLFSSAPGTIEHVRSGRLRVLSQGGEKRSPTLPDIPTMQESGVKGFLVNSVYSWAAPAGLPRPVAERLNLALVKAVQDPAARKQLTGFGAEPLGSTIEAHAAFVKSEVERWHRVIKQAGIEPQ
jgi:tripartite-type tricarboxylate transporter receptor subunit TctC